MRTSLDNHNAPFGTPMPGPSALNSSGSFGRLSIPSAISDNENKASSASSAAASPPAPRRPRLDLANFVPSSSDFMLGDHRKEMDKQDAPAVYPWLTSAIKYKEISHDDLRRMSFSSGVHASGHSISENSISQRASMMKDLETGAQATSETSSTTIASVPVGQVVHSEDGIPSSSGVLDYATIHIYEISGFDLFPPELASEESSFCGCFGCFGKRKQPASPSAVAISGNPTRNVYCELSIVEIVDEKMDMTTSEAALGHVKCSQVQTTMCQSNTLSPSWKVPGLTGPNSGRKRPKRPLLSFSASFAEILTSFLRIKFIDNDNKEIVGWVDLELMKLFEVSFGSAMTQHMKPLRITDQTKARIEEIEMEAKTPMSGRGPNGKGLEAIELKEMKMNDESPGGRLRLRTAVLSENYLLDLLRGPEEELMFAGLGLVFKMIQVCELQHLYTSTVDLGDPSQTNNPNSESDQNKNQQISREEFFHPLSLLLQPNNFQYLFSVLPIIEEHPKYVEDFEAVSGTRKRIACLLALIFTAGIQKFGTIFSSAFENFGDQLATFTDFSKFEEDVVMSFLDVIGQVPLRAKLEALTCENGKLISTLLDLCNYDRMEDVQVKALTMLNNFIEQLHDAEFWRNMLLTRISESGLEQYLTEQMESWHPKLAEESIQLIGSLLEYKKIPLNDSIRESLQRIEQENISARQGKIAQKVLFDMDFKMQQLPFSLVWSSCKSRSIYSLNNLCKQDGGDGHTPRGVYKDVSMIFEFQNAPVILTHVIACVPLHTSAHHGKFIVFCASQDRPSKSDIEEIIRMSHSDLLDACRGKWNKPVLPLMPCGHMEFTTDAYMEFSLATPTPAKFLTVIINSEDKFASKSHVEISFVAAIGYKNESEMQGKRPHLELVGEAGPHVGIKIPKKPNSNLLALLNNPEAMKGLPS